MDPLKEELKRLADTVESVDRAIRGNGTPGLRSQHNTLVERVAGIDRRLTWVIGLLSTVITASLIFMLTT